MEENKDIKKDKKIDHKKKRKKTTYTRISAALKREIRHQYAIGVDLVQLAVKYKVNYGTLKNASYAEGWEKGKLSEIVFIEEQEERKENYKKMAKTVIHNIATIHGKYLEEQGEESKAGIVHSKAKEEALLMRQRRLGTSLEQAKIIYGYRSDTEDKEYELLTMKVEKVREEMDREKLKDNLEERDEEFKG